MCELMLRLLVKPPCSFTVKGGKNVKLFFYRASVLDFLFASWRISWSLVVTVKVLGNQHRITFEVSESGHKSKFLNLTFAMY